MDTTWLWNQRIPQGAVSMLAGDGGFGKSFVMLDVIARVTKGKNFPDGSPCPEGFGAILSAEDDPHRTLRPRLDQLGADVSRALLIKSEVLSDGKSVWLDLGSHIRFFDQLMRDYPALKVICVDPVTAYLGPKVDSHKNSDVRAVLGAMSDFAMRRHSSTERTAWPTFWPRSQSI